MPRPLEPGDRSALEASIEAWWAAVLNQQPMAAHPAHDGLRARLSHATLELSGVVADESTEQDVLREARAYCGDAIQDIENSIQVAAANEDEAGILSQTVFATFGDAAQAQRAAEALRDLPGLETDSLVVLAGSDDATLHRIPPAYQVRVRKELAAGRGVLAATVDETVVLALREALDQDTSSLETVVAPPEAAPSPADSL